jgi:hypothetical protein
LQTQLVPLRNGAVIGDVKHALGMAGGEVVAQIGDEEEEDEEDENDDDDAFAVGGDFYIPQGGGYGAEDDRDDDEDPDEVGLYTLNAVTLSCKAHGFNPCEPVE